MEQRRAKRWRSRLRRAKLFDASRRLLVECRVLDLSPIGARLQPQSDRPLPLELLYCNGDGEDFRPAALVWIRKREIGISFSEAAQETEPPASETDAAQLRNGQPSA